MLFDGKGIQCSLADSGIVTVTFDIKDSGANVIGKLMMEELPKVIDALENCNEKKGIILRSNKEHFIFGADITEFLTHFGGTAETIKSWIFPMNGYLNRFEDMDVPSVCLINGFALGGGFELCLMADYRIAVKTAKVGLPETKLGIIPGWGGTVRLPRLCGADNAIEWITSGRQWKAEAALKIGAVDAIVDADQLDSLGEKFLLSCINGEMDWKQRKTEKKAPLRLNQTEATMVFETAKGFVAGMAGPNYPAPVAAIKVMQKACTLNRDEALEAEADTFAQLATTDVAHSLVEVFMGDQFLKKYSKKLTKGSTRINQAAVLGAGIMGGGVAYQSASTGTPIIMKDIAPAAIELGLTEATKLLQKQLKRKKIDPTKMANVLNIISPTLSYGDFDHV
ncbi:MAG: fatty acid oxidation complex subunit alpha FadB, partial [Halobacteriovoraceae bacterium]|nr:fatty acid oxidation complex subunit alpha FadB [Halobacteriovoraceae bacterium]